MMQHLSQPRCYLVRPGLIAGEHPGSSNPAYARENMRRLLDAGVSRFIDLTEVGEWHPYVDLAQQEANARGQTIDYRHMPIPDRQTPSVAQMQQILECIDTAPAAQRVVYVHCLAGIGRTGTVVGCHLVRSGMRGVVALHEIAQLRRGLPGGEFESPETAAQRQFVRDWR